MKTITYQRDLDGNGEIVNDSAEPEIIELLEQVKGNYDFIYKMGRKLTAQEKHKFSKLRGLDRTLYARELTL